MLNQRNGFFVKSFVFIICGWFCWVVSCRAAETTAASEQNLLSNGGFEQGETGWVFEGESLLPEKRWPDGNAYSGRHCCRIGFSGFSYYTWLDTGDTLSADLPIKPLDLLHLTFRAKWESGDNRINIGYNFRGRKTGSWDGCNDQAAYVTIPKDGRWHLMEVFFALPSYDPASSYLQFKIGAHSGYDIGAEKILLDDISLNVALFTPHQLRLKFKTVSLTEALGFVQGAVNINGESDPRIKFSCDSTKMLSEDHGSVIRENVQKIADLFDCLPENSARVGILEIKENIRMVTGSNYFIYKLPIPEKDLRKLVIQIKLIGGAIIEASLDNGPWNPIIYQREKSSGQEIKSDLIQILPLGTSGLFLASTGKEIDGKIPVYIGLKEGNPNGAKQVKWFLHQREIAETTIGTDSLIDLDSSWMASDGPWQYSVTAKIYGDKGVEIAETAGTLDIPNEKAFEQKMSELEQGRKELSFYIAKASQKGTCLYDSDILLNALEQYPAFIQEDWSQSKINQVGGKRYWHSSLMEDQSWKKAMFDRATDAMDYLITATKQDIQNIKDSLLTNNRSNIPMPSVLNLQVRQGSFYQGNRPVFLIGPMRDRISLEEIARISRYGFNAIELVVAPAWDSPEDYKYYKDFLDLCQRQNIAVYVLLSAHYFPGEWTKEHPELQECGDFCMPWCISNPYLREKLAEWYRKIIPFLKDQPAVLSYCLANEPHYKNTGYCPKCKANFQNWLKNKYETIEALNQRWGTALASFDQVEPIKEQDAKTPATYYDWYSFNEYRVAKFFQWERETIRSLDPRTPIHNESMATCMFLSLNDGMDVEMQAAQSDIHGCDGGTRYVSTSNVTYTNFTSDQSMPYDLMKSVAPQMPIFNSEWHIVTQNNKNIPPEYMRATAWLATIHGQGGATIWVWLRNWDEDQKVCLSARPGIVVTAGKVCRELNRHAEEVGLFQRPPAGGHREVCILYSTSTLANDAASRGRYQQVYDAMYLLDAPLGFVTEKQLEKENFAGCKLLVVPNTAYFTDAGVAGLEKYIQQGGTVLFMGDCFTYNEYGKARGPVKFMNRAGTYGKGNIHRLNISTTPEVWSKTMDKLMTQGSVYRPVRVKTPGVLCRTVLDKEKNRNVGVLINLSGEAKNVQFEVTGSHGKIQNLLTGETISDKLNMRPFDVILFAVEMQP